MSNSTEAIAAQGRKRKSRPYTRRRPRPRFSTSGVMSTNARMALRVTEEEGRLQEGGSRGGRRDDNVVLHPRPKISTRAKPPCSAVVEDLRRPRANEAVEAAGDSAGVPQCFIFAVAIDARMPAAEARLRRSAIRMLTAGSNHRRTSASLPVHGQPPEASRMAELSAAPGLGNPQHFECECPTCRRFRWHAEGTSGGMQGAMLGQHAH